jgi:SAM-dependent methyltransferase
VLEVGRAYDARADEYVALLGRVDLLADEDRALLTRWRDATDGPLLDAGCGPGHWSALLGQTGAPVLGVDLSERFLAHARRTYARPHFVRASLAALPLADASVGGVLAWFSTLHVEPARLPGVLAELGRVVTPGGSLLLGYPDGPAGQAYAHAVTTAWFTSLDALRPVLDGLGLEVVEHHARHDEGARPVAALVARRGPRS